jgi:DEAD/DEAH box helicase domain-containing protein
MRTVVFDIETKNVFDDVGKADPTLLEISVVAAYDSETDQYASYTEDELPSLWPTIEQADALVGFNSDHFDIPLLNAYYPGDLTAMASIDLLKDIKHSLGRRIKLDTIAEATLGTQKSGHGLQAIQWWKQGEIDKIRSYCVEDVRITKEVFDYAQAHGKLLYKDGGQLCEIPIDTSHWQQAKRASMTHTLPF